MKRSPSSSRNLRHALAQHGLSGDIVHEVVVRGETERNSVTANDAPGRGGLGAYFERVRAMRDLLIPLGWTSDNSKNLCTVVSPCGQHAVAVIAGDRLTAQEGSPQPKYPRGNATAFAVNRAQLDLFPEEEQQDRLEAQRALWFLLVHRPAGGSEVRAELSLPAAISEDGSVTRWTERNPLEPIDLTDGVEIDGDETVDEAIEVAVQRKS